MTKFVLTITPADKIHVSFLQRKNKILKFSVHYTALINKRWISIIRYDTAHKFWKLPHKHLFYTKKKPVIIFEKEQNYNILFTKAYEDIKKNYRKYKDNYLTNK